MKKINVLSSLLCVFILTITCLISCQGEYGSKDSLQESGSDSYMNGSVSGAYPKQEGDAPSQSNDSGLTENRKIIKTVNQSLQTDNFDATIDNVYALVDELGGYVTNSSLGGKNYYNSDNLRYAKFTIRIPADKLSDFSGRVENGAVLTSYSESAEDVSDAYITVESKIAVFEAEETALLEMLQNATEIDSLLEIRTRLNEVQYNLSSLRAQKQKYDSLISYSTVYLYVDEVRNAVRTNPGFFEEVGVEFSESLYGIGRFWRNFAVWFIGNIISIIMWGAVIFIVVFFLVKFRKRRKAKSKKQDNKEE